MGAWGIHGSKYRYVEGGVNGLRGACGPGVYLLATVRDKAAKGS